MYIYIGSYSLKGHLEDPFNFRIRCGLIHGAILLDWKSTNGHGSLLTEKSFLNLVHPNRSRIAITIF